MLPPTHDSLVKQLYSFSFSHSIFFIVVYTRAGVVYVLSLAPAASYGLTRFLIPPPTQTTKEQITQNVRAILPSIKIGGWTVSGSRRSGEQEQQQSWTEGMLILRILPAWGPADSL